MIPIAEFSTVKEKKKSSGSFVIRFKNSRLRLKFFNLIIHDCVFFFFFNSFKNELSNACPIGIKNKLRFCAIGN